MMIVIFTFRFNSGLFQMVANFSLPDKVTTNESSCFNTNSTLKLNFGAGHSWTVNFTLTEKQYQADAISFSYNLNDTTVFKNSTSNGNF